MNREQLKTYLEAQLREIEKYKWLISEQECCDVGFERAAFEWIRKYGDHFRQHYFARHKIDTRTPG